LFTNQAMTENQEFYPRHGYVETARGRGMDTTVFSTPRRIAAQ
jgi:hypothetical protein